MDWKWSYADGRLDHWSVPDMHEFLFEWCTRKLSAPQSHCAELPLSVAAFIEFLAHTGMLAPGSTAPSAIRKHCESNVDKFVREMGNPANHGMAESLFGGAGGDMLQLDDALDELDDVEPPEFAPVRLPSEDERLAVVRSLPLMGQLRTLAEYCAPPGRKLTAKGNLPLAELVDLALNAGVVHQQQGRLVAVEHSTALDELAAYEKVVLTVLDAGSAGLGSPLLNPLFAQLDAIVDMFATAVLAELLRHRPGGLDADLVEELLDSLAESAGQNLPDFMRKALAMQAHERIDQLVDLRVLAIDGGNATPCDECGDAHPEGGSIAITAAGVPIAIELLGRVGAEVPIRPEPADADAAAIVDLFEHLGEEALGREVAEWFAAQPDPQAAASALATESLAAHRDTITAMTGIHVLDGLTDDAVELVRSHLEGPHDGLVLNWLMSKDALDPDSVDPTRIMSGVIDFLSVDLDTAGPEEAAPAFSELPDGGRVILDQVWRLDHPRLPDVLDAVGKHHPVKSVAKAARKTLMKHKSRVTGAPR